MIGFTSTVRRLSIKIGQSKSKMSKCHVKCRNVGDGKNEIYPRSDKKRFLVPDDKVPWSVPFPEYKPPEFTTPGVLAGPYYADPDISKCPNDATLKWNEVDGKVSRESFMGKYDVVDGLPRNPMGRTGIIHRGCLGRWGPNHAADPIVTRWKRDDDGNIVKDENDKPIAQFVAVQRRDNKEWAIPGGMVDPGDKVSATIQKEFGEEALDTLQMTEEERKEMSEKITTFLSGGTQIYEGYVDDPRNTDNAWMETTVYNFHDNDGSRIGQFNLKAGDDAQAVQWMDLHRTLNLYASHSHFMEKVAERLGASW